MECDWKIGDVVECVEKFLNDGKNEWIYPKLGMKYTIRGIRPYPNDTFGILLNEVINGIMVSTSREPSFVIFKFRKLQTKKTDISIFKSMLNKSPEQNKREHNESKVRDAIQEFAH